MKYIRYGMMLLPVWAASIFYACNKSDAGNANTSAKLAGIIETPKPADADQGRNNIDSAQYDRLQLHLVHDRSVGKWPVNSGYPLPGAILPFKRIVAYYGNFYSKGMGVLGELPESEMLRKLQQEVKAWEHADPLIPVQPALHYITVTAQHSPGASGKYRLRMPDQQVQKALDMARSVNAILILDVQVGHSSLQEELPALEPFLKLPDVHLGIDPEYSMKGGQVPCAAIGTFDAADINYSSAFLANIVKKYSLAPKVLVVHRFTKNMVTNYRQIVLHPEVQVVINMDGFGFPAKKINSYHIAVTAEPVQYAGFKLFYKNDRLNSPYRLMTPAEILALTPSPIYIQYQ